MLWIETQREPSLILLSGHLTGSHNQSLTLESIRNKISHTVIRGIISLITCMAFCNTAATFPPLPWAFSWCKNQNSNQKCEGHTSESLSLYPILSNMPGSPTVQLNRGLGDIYYEQANILLFNFNSKMRKYIANNWVICSFIDAIILKNIILQDQFLKIKYSYISI